MKWTRIGVVVPVLLAVLGAGGSAPAAGQYKVNITYTKDADGCIDKIMAPDVTVPCPAHEAWCRGTSMAGAPEVEWTVTPAIDGYQWTVKRKPCWYKLCVGERNFFGPGEIPAQKHAAKLDGSSIYETGEKWKYNIRAKYPGPKCKNRKLDPTVIFQPGGLYLDKPDWWKPLWAVAILPVLLLVGWWLARRRKGLAKPASRR